MPREPTANTTLTIQGIEIPKLGLGTWPMRGETCVEAVRDALELGYRHVDTARAYENEAEVGRGLAEGGVDRAELWLTTKVPYERLRAGEVRADAEGSLRALGTDYVDLLLIHWPSHDVPLAETLGEMGRLRDEGKVRHVGLSNATVAQLEEAERIVPVAAVQNELSPRYLAPLANGEVEACERRGIPFLAWSPLGGPDASDDVPAGVAAIREIASERGVSPQRVTLAWLLSLSETVVPLVGASRPETIRDSVAALDLTLTENESRRLAEELA